jgi:Insect cuticle protein
LGIRCYLVFSSQYFSGFDSFQEPASYEFKYEVNDAATQQEFGHMESREGDVVTGEYRVLLPDGRTQVVKYVADKDGYRPTIEYLEPNNQQQGGYY